MRTILLVVMLVGLVSLAGCATLTQSGPEVRAAYKRTMTYELQELSADWNYIWLADHPSRLTQWQMR